MDLLTLAAIFAGTENFGSGSATITVTGSGVGPNVIYQLNEDVSHAIGAVSGSGEGRMDGQGRASIAGIRAVIPIGERYGLTGEIGSDAARIRGVRAKKPPLSVKYGLTGGIASDYAAIPAVSVDGFLATGNLGSGSGTLAPVYGYSQSGYLGRVGSGSGQIVVRGSGEGYVSAVGASPTARHIVVLGRSPSVNITGVPDETITVFVMNLNTGAVSIHTTEYNSWCVVDGVLYGADSEGIHKVLGFDDNGVAITGRFSKVNMDMGTPKEKFFTDVYFRGTTTGDHTITVNSERNSGSVTMVDGMSEYHGAKSDLPKGVRGRELGITVKNDDGAYFEWSEMEILASEATTRRGRQVRGG